MNLNEQIKKLKNKNNKKIFFTSDLHFDDNRLNLFGRDLIFNNYKEVNNHIIENWNKNVTKNDLVIVVGDISLTEKGLENINKCNGEKWLIKGNYDYSKSDGGTSDFNINDKILSKYFSKIYDEIEMKIGNEIIYINHYPTNSKKDIFNIHGHIHAAWKVQRNMINVSTDAWHFMPISEDLIKFQINGIKNHYDQNVFAGELISNIKNRKGEIKVLRPPEYCNVDFNDDIIIFLAGPIQGANEWQDTFINKISNEFKNKYINKNIIIASPRRVQFKKDKKTYQKQVEWENYYLDKASKQGIVIFWLANEKEKVEGHSYAQTTRFEIGEWFAKGQQINNFNIVVGHENEFNGIKYISKKFKDAYNIKINTNINDMIKNINDKINERIYE